MLKKFLKNLKHKIIIEGFWKVGKSTLINNLSEDLGYSIIEEPNHLEKGVCVGIDTNKWYIEKHLRNQKRFFKDKNEKLIMERSILASGAFLYATNEDEKTIREILSSFVLEYKKYKSLIVFLYSGKKMLKKLGRNKLELLQNNTFIEKYDEFFRRILPFVYDITPIFINIEGKNKLKSPKRIENNVISVIENNRLAQINVVCYKKELKGEPLFLLLKRNPQKGGFWQTVSGGVKTSNTLRETIFAELKEELGLQVKKEKILETQHSFHYIGSEDYELNEYVFGYRLDNSDKITLSEEHTEYKFVDLNEAIKLVKYQTNRELLRKVYDLVAKK